MRHAVARSLSVIGHPALLVPAAVALAASRQGLPAAQQGAALGATVFVALAVLAYGRVQVRGGRWGHVDAKVPPERG